MPWTRIQLQPLGDVEGHAASGHTVEVERIALTTSDGEEVVLEPEGEEEEGRFRVASGPDDLVGHVAKVRF